MDDDDWLYQLWVILLLVLLVLLCARLWVCLMRLMVGYERDKQTDDDHPGGAG